jgi:hypothetical protein
VPAAGALAVALEHNLYIIAEAQTLAVLFP